MAIHILAGLTFLFGVFALIRALDLVPTELGFTWMLGAFIAFATSLIILAIGLAARRIEKAIQSGAVLSGLASITGGSTRTEPAAPAMGPAPEAAAPASEGTGLGKAAGIGAAGLAAGAAATMLATGAKADTPQVEDLGSQPPKPDPAMDDMLPPWPPVTSAQMPANSTGRIEPTLPDPIDLPPLRKLPPLAADDAFMAEFEKDIFAEFRSPADPAPADNAPPAAADADILAELRLDPPEEPAAPADPAAEDDDILLPASEKPSEPQADNAVSDESDAEEAPAEAPAPAAAIQTSPPEPGPADDEAEEQPQAPSKPAPAPGLIPDDDLAALEMEQPAFAPLETLDVVGSYDSGGTRFTMYSDGSVTAVGPTLDRRFESLDKLRAFIDGGAKG
jgi:hypothetical protein